MQDRARFLSFLQRPSTLAELQAGQQIFGAEEIQSFVRSAREPNEALQELSPLLLHIDGFHAGALALMCGSLVEHGGDVSIAIDETLDLMWQQLQQVVDYVNKRGQLSEAELLLHYPTATRAHYGLPFTLLAAMTMLCRDKETRKQWQCRQDVVALVSELEKHYETLSYVKDVLALLDDKDLLILDPLNKRGFHTRLVGVQDRMYHCYALLQHALLEHTGPGYLDAKSTDPLAVRYAQNNNLTTQDYQRARDLSDEQRFGFYYPVGWHEHPENVFLFFPGSASYYEIPVIHDMRVLLIGKTGPTFTWGPANMYPVLHEALTSRVDIVRELPPEEVEIWSHRLQRKGDQ